MNLYDHPDLLIELTPEWTGERYPDGRPKVSDSLLQRLSHLKLEEVYMPLYAMGYKYQFEGDMKIVHPGKKMIGRAVTAIMVPTRPDIHRTMLEYGRNQEHRKGFFNQWVIESMVEGDILVADMFDRIYGGTYVGGNLSTAIMAHTKTGGAVIWGGIRDLEQIVGVEGFQCYYRGVHLTPVGDVMMTGMNMPTRIGQAICMPGDVVIGTIEGIVFLPAHLAETVAQIAEKTRVKDMFGFERLATKTYESSEIDQTWWDRRMMEDFIEWFHTSEKAKDFQYLDWSEEMAHCDDPQTTRRLDGIYLEKLV